MNYQTVIPYLNISWRKESLVRSKMAITLELNLCQSNFSRGIEGQIEDYQGTNII